MFKNPFKRKRYEPLPYEEVYDYYLTKEREKQCKYKSVHHGFSTKGLPFEPSHDEVIYVENEYDETTNRFILDNINVIRDCFAKKNFVFVYLPLIGQELASDSIWHYRKPYGQAERISELPSLRSNYMLDFMKNPQNRSNISPCFARYNYSIIDFDAATNEHVQTWNDIFDTFTFDVNEAKDIKEYFECLSEYVAGKLFWWSGLCCRYKKEFEDADAAFDYDTKKLIAEIKYRIELLRRKGISDVILEQIVKPETKLSRIVIRKDNCIILPDYNNMEITMPPLVKAVYLLFLKHPEGILFKHLPDYRRELSLIYDDIKGYPASSRKVLGIRKYSDNIINVTDPLNNSINEKCARIKEAFLLKFHESMASQYFITGKRGEPKRIMLPKELIVWEE